MSEEYFRIAQLVVWIIGILGVGLIPNYFYQRRLESFKNDLDSKLTLLGVTVEQNHGPKMETYKSFMVANYNAVKQPSSANDRKLIAAMAELSRVIFLYGSDESINAFIAFREYDVSKMTEENKYENMVLLAKLMASLRKDLNPGEVDTKAETYLRILLNDWNDVKPRLLKYL